MAKKHLLRPPTITCGRCGYRGLAKQNRIHWFLLFLIGAIVLYYIINFFYHPFSSFIEFAFSATVLGGVAQLILRDERALLCPQCGNVNYDVVR